nr:MAG TPA: Lysis protein [Caudoviricetes sp.]
MGVGIWPKVRFALFEVSTRAKPLLGLSGCLSPY